MTDVRSPFSKSHPIQQNGYGGCDVYYMKPGSSEPIHFHDCVEVLFILKGSSSSHQQGKAYVYQAGEVHGIVNDANEEMVFTCMQIPPESDENTQYV